MDAIARTIPSGDEEMKKQKYELVTVAIPVQESKAKLHPQSVYLNESDLDYLQTICNQYKVKRHALLQYAVRELIRRWKKGEQLRFNNVGKLDM